MKHQLLMMVLINESNSEFVRGCYSQEHFQFAVRPSNIVLLNVYLCPQLDDGWGKERKPKEPKQAVADPERVQGFASPRPQF